MSRPRFLSRLKPPARAIGRFARLSVVLLLIGGITLSNLSSALGQPDAAPSAPRVIASYPAQREVVGPDVTVQLMFDQAMNRDSVQGLFAILPKVEGTFAWSDDFTLTFDPAGALNRGVEYTITIEPDALSAGGTPLGDRFHLTFQVAPNLSVNQVIPAPGATEVEAGTSVTLVFDRPVVPLVTTGDQSKLPQPLSFSPAVEGTGEWVGTAIYIFTPRTAFGGGTLYTATVSGDLKDVDGSPIGAPYTWQFRTVSPQILSIYPYDNAAGIYLEAALQVTFNQPMNRDSVRAAFSLRNLSTGADVAGALAFSDNDQTITFTPAARLELQTRYRINVTGDARSANGEAGLTNPQGATFSTVPYPRVLETYPRSGETVSPGSGVTIRFNTPMNDKTFPGRVKVEPQPEKLSVSASYDSLYIGFSSLPETTYTITLEAGAEDLYGNPIKEPYTFSFRTSAYRPSLRIPTRGSVSITSAYRDVTELLASGVNVETIDMKLTTLEPAEFLAMSQYYGDVNAQDYPPARVTRSWTVKTDLIHNQLGYFRLKLAEDEKQLPPGIYYFEAFSPQFLRFLQSPLQQPIRRVVVVATAQIVVKIDTAGNAMAWVTDLKSGQPVPGARVTFYDDSRAAAGEAVTDADGLARLKLPSDLNNRSNYWVMASGDNIMGLTHTYWADGFNAYEFDSSVDYAVREANLYLYTDQPIYRPGRPVYFRGIVRGQFDTTYSVPAGEKITVRITDPNGQELLKQDVTLNEYGAFSGRLDLLPQGEATLGYYYIQAQWGENVDGLGFQVAEYRPPEFLVTATADKPEYVAGDTIKVAIEGKFLFGGAVSGGNVNWVAYANQGFFAYSGIGVFDFYNWRHDWVYNRQVASGNGTLDASGKLLIDLPADLAGSLVTQDFTIEATVSDISNQYVSGRTSVTVHPANLYVGISTEKYIGKAGEPTTAHVTTVDWHSNPLPNQRVVMKVIDRRWKQNPDTFEWKQETTTVAEETLTTDADGKATFTFTPTAAGYYEIEATARDERERMAVTSFYLWVQGPNPISMNDQDRKITLVADRRGEYKQGETAEILIPSPFPEKVKALVTVERAHIMKTEIIEIEGSYTYRLPIDPDSAPNVYVSVVLVRGAGAGAGDNSVVADARYGLVNLNVEVRKQLKVQITPSTERAEPGAEVRFDVLTTDLDGNPVAAEVGVSLSDVATLSVGSPNSVGIFSAYWYTRPLGVLTASSIQRLLDNIKLTEAQEELEREAKSQRAAADGILMAQPTMTAALGESGGGAAGAPPAPAMEMASDEADKGAAPGAVSPTPRTDFVDTPLWKADLVTDSAGRASVSVTLPDNLTTWRLEARAISVDTFVGDATVEIMSTKPLLVRPATPRFFVVGDSAELSVVVNNNTGAELSVDVSLDAKGVTLRADSTQTVTIPADGRIKVIWLAEVENTDFVDLTFAAVSGEFADASKPAVGIGDARLLPVYKYEAPDYVATAGLLRTPGERTEGILLPSAEMAPSGDLTVKVNSSLAAVTLDGLSYLRTYPYYCLEQTVSRFLPNVITYRALQKVGLDNPALRADLEAGVQYALGRLKTEQKPDGGWGWYYNEESNLLTTSYALLGLIEARDADFAVEPEMIRRAVEFIQARLPFISDQTRAWELNRTAFTLMVLARAGNPNPRLMDDLFARRERMNLDARAYLALAYQNAEAEQVRTLLSDLQTRAIVSGTGIHWEEDSRDWWNWGSNTRSTAIILLALSRYTPQSDLIPNVVRWLMVARRGDAWETTQETAWAVMSLTEWMVVSGELKADYAFKVNLNDTLLGEGQATKDTLRDTTLLKASVQDMLRDQINRLTFRHEAGEGTLYYTAALKVNQPVEFIKPTDRGLSFNRAYFIDGKPVTSASVGDVITVVLEITASQDLYYVVINDPIPAGTEPLDRSLQTTAQFGERPNLTPDDYRFWGWGWWYFSDTQLRTEKAVLSAPSLPRGSYRYVYQIQATTPGTYRVIPPNGNEFYFPEVFGRGAGSLFIVYGE